MSGDSNLTPQPDQSQSELRHADPNPDKLLDHWLEGAKGTDSAQVPGKGISCSQIGLQYFLDGPNQPKAPGENATEEQRSAYGKQIQEWRQQANEHTEEADKIIKYDKLNDDQRETFKGDLNRFLQNSGARPFDPQSDDAVKTLEQGVKSFADGQKWLKAIADWDNYRTHCTPEN
jgi:hypothetical protein